MDGLLRYTLHHGVHCDGDAVSPQGPHFGAKEVDNGARKPPSEQYPCTIVFPRIFKDPSGTVHNTCPATGLKCVLKTSFESSVL